MSNPIDPEIIDKLVSSLLAAFDRLSAHTTGDPTLAPEFRCPIDNSSRTAKISELLASRPRGSVLMNGKSASFVGGSAGLDELDPGPMPRNRTAFFVFGLCVLLAGCLIALFGASPMRSTGGLLILMGGVTAGAAWHSDLDLPIRYSAWKNKEATADTHWRCEACGKVFLPEAKPDGILEGTETPEVPRIESPLEDGVPEVREEARSEPGNVEPLRRQD